MADMVAAQMDARLCKIASMGFEKNVHLGESILNPALIASFHKMRDEFYLNVCGEGGEYETCVLDCPIFKNKRIVAETRASRAVLDVEVFEEKTAVDPVCHFKFIEGKCKVVEKDQATIE